MKRSVSNEQKVLIVVTNASQFKDGKPTGLWLEEAAIPYKVFIKNGLEVDIASVKVAVFR